MSIFEWIWLAVFLFGLLAAFRSWRFDGNFHGASMAKVAGIRFGLALAAVGGVLFLITLAT